MCEPLSLMAMASLGGGLLGLGGSLMSSTPEPPAAQVPAIAAPTSRNPGATVRIGNSDNDITNNLSTEDPSKPVFNERRTTGNALGNLGKSSLIL